MSAHTKAPWRYVPELYSSKCVIMLEDRTEARWLAHCQPEFSGEANAARIVACINACEGIENPARIADLIDAAKEIVEILEPGFNRDEIDSFTAQRLRLAIDALGVK